MLWATARLAGTGEYALRLPSAAAGTLLVAVAYRLGRSHLSLAVGLAGALFAAVSPFLVWYGQEARMYALLAALAGLSTLAWLRLASGRSGRLVYVAATAAALYTHYYALFLLPAQLVAARPRRGLLAMAAALALFLPWLPALATQGGRGTPGYRPDTPLHEVLAGLYAAYPLGDSFPPVLPAALAFAALGLLGVAAGPGRRAMGPFLLAWTLLAPLLAYGASFALGLELRATGRMYYLAGALPFLLLAARGAAALRWPPLVAAVVLVLTGTQALVLYQQIVGRQKEDWHGTAALVAARAWPGDGVAIVAEPLFRDQPFRYYFRGDAPLSVLDAAGPDLDSRLDALASAHRRLWLLRVHGPIADPMNRVQTWLDDWLIPLDDRPDPDLHLRLYSTERRPRLDALAVERPLGVRLGDLVELVGWSGPREADPGGRLRVELVWRALAPGRASYHVALMLVDGGVGPVRAQTDRVAVSPFHDATRWRAGEYLTDRYDLPLPRPMLGGGYRLRLRLYDPATNATLRPPGGGDLVDLGPVRVGPRRFDPPRPQHPSGARLGDAVELVGYDLVPGSAGRLRVTLWWRALAQPSQDFTVFTHLVGADGRLITQRDAPPVDGTYPTSLWVPGEIVRDDHDLTGSLGAGAHLSVGMYLPDTGARLGDAIRLSSPLPLGAASRPEGQGQGEGVSRGGAGARP